MRRIAELIMSSRQHAIMLALLFSIIPLVSWVSVVILCLVTLRKGAREGFWLLAWLALPTIVMGVIGYPELALTNLLFNMVYAFCLALVLRYSMSWSLVIEVGAVLGLVGVVAFHLVIGDTQAFWWSLIQSNFVKYSQAMQLKVTLAEVKPYLYHQVRYLTGINAAFYLLSALLNIALARGLQAMLYNPGGLRQELYNVRLSRLALGGFVLVFALYLLNVSAAYDALVVAALPLVLAGVSLCHSFLVQAKRAKWGLLGFYMLVLTFFSFSMWILICSAIADGFMNFRRQWHYHEG
jgi:hypothetical protein